MLFATDLKILRCPVLSSNMAASFLYWSCFLQQVSSGSINTGNAERTQQSIQCAQLVFIVSKYQCVGIIATHRAHPGTGHSSAHTDALCPDPDRPELFLELKEDVLSIKQVIIMLVYGSKENRCVLCITIFSLHRTWTEMLSVKFILYHYAFGGSYDAFALNTSSCACVWSRKRDIIVDIVMTIWLAIYK